MLYKKNIFLIEDNDNDINLIMNIFNEIKIIDNIKIFKDGNEAHNYFFYQDKNENHEFIYPSVVFLDIKIPNITGLELLKKIREDKRYKFIPIVMLTSSNHERDIRESYLFGANGYVVKPVNYKEFAFAIKSTLNYWLNTNVPPLY